MFGSMRWLKVGYVLALAISVVLLSQPGRAPAQVSFMRSPVAPMQGQVTMMMQPSIQQAQMMLMTGSMGGGMMGFAGKGMGGFNGKKAL